MSALYESKNSYMKYKHVLKCVSTKCMMGDFLTEFDKEKLFANV